MISKSFLSWKKDILKQASQLRAPLDVIFELTSRCNFNCKMCYVHNQDNEAASSKELSTDQWKKVMDEAIECGMLFATLTGGECLLRSDFQELYLYLYNKGILISIFSNAFLMNEKYLDFFSKYPPKEIQVSLYGSNNDFYENVTGVRAFDIVSRNLLRLRDLTQVSLRVAVTPSRYLFDDYRRILEFCKSNNLECVYNEMFLFDNRDDKDNDHYKLTVPDFVDLEIVRRQVDERTLTPLVNLPIPCGNCSEPLSGTQCSAGTCRAFITWDGFMAPCVNLLICKESVITKGFSEAWKANVQFANDFLQPLECNGCAYAKVCFHCPGIRLATDQSGHCNPFACKLTVEKCKAGIFNSI